MYNTTTAPVGVGITQVAIQKKRDSIKIGDHFAFRGLVGRVVEKYKHFCVVEKPQGYVECMTWIDMCTVM